MHDIGSQCPYVNGPAVYDARSLYEKFTGIIMPDVDCPELENRSNKQYESHILNDGDIIIYPNPADDILVVNLPGRSTYYEYQASISNVLGKVVLKTRIYPGSNQIPVKTMSNGIYFVHITLNGASAISKPIFIQH